MMHQKFNLELQTTDHDSPAAMNWRSNWSASSPQDLMANDSLRLAHNYEQRETILNQLLDA